MRSISRRPSRSKRQSSTFVALAENSAKLVPRPSQVAPSGCGAPAATRLLARGNEKERSKGWDDNVKLRAMACHNCGYATGVPDIAASISPGVGSEDFAPRAGDWHAHAVIVDALRGVIDDDDDALVRFLALAQPGECRVAGIVGHQPFEARCIAVERVECRRVAVKAVQVAHQPLHPGVL